VQVSAAAADAVGVDDGDPLHPVRASTATVATVMRAGSLRTLIFLFREWSLR